MTGQLGTNTCRLGTIRLGLSTEITSTVTSGFTGQLGTKESKFANIEFGVGVPLVGGVSAANNILSLAQTVSVNKILNFNITHTLSLTSEGHRAYQIVADNDILFSHSLSYEKAKHLNADNAIVYTQTASVAKVVNRSLISTLSYNQQIVRNINKLTHPTNTLNLTQAVTVTVSKSTKNTLVFTQTSAYKVSKVGKNTIAFTQTMNLNLVVKRGLNDILGLYQNVQLGPNTFRRTIQQTLAFTQQATGQAVKGINHTLTLTQSATVNKVRGASNNLIFAQSASSNVRFSKLLTSRLALVQSLRVNRTKSLSASNAFALTQSTTRQKLIVVSAHNDLHLIQELVRQKFIRSLNQTLALTQQVTGYKLVAKAISHSLVLTQNVSLTKTLNVSGLNTLVFKNSFQKRVAMGPVTTITVPETQVVKVKNLVILRAENRAIVLPAPEFNDSEAGTGSLNIIRFKTGGRRVYVSDTGKQVLSYDFALERNKYLELKSFIKTYNSSPVFLENWRGEIWYVLFNTNPFSFNEEKYWKDEIGLTGGNKFTVTLSFNGVRVN